VDGGRAQTRAEEIAAILNLTPAEVIDALTAGSALDVRSLDEASPGAGRSRYSDRMGADDAGFELVEDRSVIDRPGACSIPASASRSCCGWSTT
jgi:DNA-directed RNA polymerase specialized sigma subunit